MSGRLGHWTIFPPRCPDLVGGGIVDVLEFVEARERDEEALIELNEEEGPAIHRRLDADPRAVLGIALAQSKRPKLERVKAA